MKKLLDWLDKIFGAIVSPKFPLSKERESESKMKECCKSILCSPALSATATSALEALPGVDWAALFSLFVKYGAAVVIPVLEQVIPTLPVGALWQTLLAAVLSELAKLTTPTA